MAQEDGGPAFPTSSEKGMSLRDWMAAHAPAVPPLFQPLPYEPYPEFPQIGSYVRGDGLSEAAHAEYDRLIKAREAKLLALEIAREASWRYAFADAMFAARQKAGEP